MSTATQSGSAVRWTSADLDGFPDDGKRREIIDGELYVSKQPNWYHQTVSGRIFAVLDEWSVRSGSGGASIAPGLIFADDDDVAPDVAWASTARLSAALAQGKLYAAPELAVEVLSPGAANIRLDRETKRKLYTRRGVAEYWIIDWPRRSIDIYRLAEGELTLTLTLGERDTLIRFPDPDGSLKRPDIAIFCDEPPDSDEALEVLPVAVIELLSLGYEEKDLGPDGASFYLACGVRDVLIVDPRGGSTLHYQLGTAAPASLRPPVSVDLQCGCRVRLT